MDGAVIEVPGDDAAADAVVIHQEVEHEILDEELGGVAQRLLVERVQHGVAGAVGGGTGALCDALAEAGRHAAERPLIDLALGRAAERHAEMLELDDRRDRLAHHVFDGVLVAQPVRPLDGVVHVPAPIILAHVAERGADAALGGDGVAAGREQLAEAGGAQALLRHAEGGAQAGPAAADHDDVVAVVGDRIGLPVGPGSGDRFVGHRMPQPPIAMVKSATSAAVASTIAAALTRITATSLAASLPT